VRLKLTGGNVADCTAAGRLPKPLPPEARVVNGPSRDIAKAMHCRAMDRESNRKDPYEQIEESWAFLTLPPRRSRGRRIGIGPGRPTSRNR